MENKDLVLVSLVFLIGIGVVGFLLFSNGNKDTGVNEVIDKYAKEVSGTKVNANEKVSVNNEKLAEKEQLAKVAVKYKEKLNKAVKWLDDNYKNLVGQNVKFKLYDIDDTKGYVVMYLNASVGNRSEKILALLSKKNDTLLFGGIVPTKELFKNMNVTLINDSNNNVANTFRDLIKKSILEKIKNKTVIVKVYNVSEDKDLLWIQYNVTVGNNSGIIPIVLTKDGKYMLNIGAVMSFNLNEKIEPPKQPPAPKQKPIPKSDKPTVKLFVMSYCPFGVQMERAILPVINLLKDKVNFEIEFVDYSIHGKKEINENLRQYCIEKINKNEYWKYLKCFIATGNSTLCLNNISIDRNELDRCINETDKEYNVSYYRDNTSTYLSGYFPRFLVNEKDNKKYNVQGSPTTIINGVEYVGDMYPEARSPEALKEAICSAFTNKPPECNVKLSNKTVPYGIGAVGQGGGVCA